MIILQFRDPISVESYQSIKRHLQGIAIPVLVLGPTVECFLIKQN